MRIGIDFGGTKIEAAALSPDGDFLDRRRRPNPGAYAPALEVVRDLVDGLIRDFGPVEAVGAGIPGSISPVTGLIRNANSTWLNGHPLQADLQRALGRPVRLANDANCFALSEAVDGAASGARVVFGVILGTGCGGGLVVDGQVIDGRNGVGGEWGHAPLPWSEPDEHPGPACWCGRRGCLETFISGPAFERDFANTGGTPLPAEAIAELACGGDPLARAALDRLIGRLGRGLAMVCDIVDPDAIVLGGGLSNIAALYPALPAVVSRHLFSDRFETAIVPARHGDSSGVRGAAWLQDDVTPMR